MSLSGYSCNDCHTPEEIIGLHHLLVTSTTEDITFTSWGDDVEVRFRMYCTARLPGNDTTTLRSLNNLNGVAVVSFKATPEPESPHCPQCGHPNQAVQS